MKRLYVFIAALAITGCIEKPDFAPEEETVALEDLNFPANFLFETSSVVEVNITDYSDDNAKYKLNYRMNGEAYEIGSYFKQHEGFSDEITIPSAAEEIEVVKITATAEESYRVPVVGSQANLDVASLAGDGSNCYDHLYAVNGDKDFFSIDVSNDQFADISLPDLPGGSIANALDQANNTVYINVNTTLYAYDIAAQTFTVKHQSNPFNKSYPRLEFYEGHFYMSNGSKMYKVNAETNETVASYNISGFVNSTSGGDLAFDSNGELYLACFSGLYKFTEINDQAGTAEIIRISAENFPFQLTSMAIDRQDRIFVGTNDANSNLIQISKEDGAYSIVKTFNKKINDLTAWKCATEDLPQNDSDGDGVIDELDDYPDDPDIAADVFTPSELGMGSYAFEDMWPNLGDYDFNDMVVSYRYVSVLNGNNELVRFKMNFLLKAVGAGERSGFGIELEVDPSKISSVSGHSTLGNNTTLDAKGLESGQGKAVIIVFNDTRNHMQPAAGESFVNTDPSESIIANVPFEVVIEFTQPIDPSEIGNAPFNPFIFASGDRGKEVHLAGKMPTSLADQSTFGTSQDDTNIGLGRTYLTENNLPWAIHIIHNFRYPIEKARINTGYNKFVDWSKSSGVLYKDWYGDNSGYRNTSKLFIND